MAFSLLPLHASASRPRPLSGLLRRLTDKTTPAVEPKPRTWTRLVRGAAPVTVTCPTWCTADHSIEETRPFALDDLTHAGGSTPCLEVGDIQTSEILNVMIHQDPYSEHSHMRAPHAELYVGAGEWLEYLDPDQLAEAIRQVEGHVAEMRNAHARLVAARAEYERGL